MKEIPNSLGAGLAEMALRRAIDVLAAWHLRYTPVPNSLEPYSCVQSIRGTTRASLVPPLRYGTKLAFTCSGTSSHSAAFGVELEQPLKRRSCIQISQRIGGAANPGPQPDGYRAVARHRRLVPSALAVSVRDK